MICLFIVLSTFAACNKVWHLSSIEPASKEVNSSNVPAQDTAILALVAPYKKQLDAEMNEEIGRVARTMPKARPHSKLGNWFADLIHEKSSEYYKERIDFAVVNYGGIRIPELREGPLVRGRIYELMPFENMLVVLKVKGMVVKEFFDLMAKDGGWPLSSQAYYEIKNGTAQNILIRKKALQADQIYTMVLPDFIANGGGNCFFLKEQPRVELGVLMRTAIFDYIEAQTAQGKSLSAPEDKRIISKD